MSATSSGRVCLGYCTSAVCDTEGPVECFRIPSATFKSVLANSDYFSQLKAARRLQNEETISYAALQHADEDAFEFMYDYPNSNRVYSSLQCVWHKHTRGVFCMRVARKDVLQEASRASRVVDERRMLLELFDCPFVVDLVTTFRDDLCLFFVEEFLPGGSVLNLMKRSGVD